MAIVTYHYRPKRAPRKQRKQSPIASRIVTPAKLKPIKGPVIRLGAQRPAETPGLQLPTGGKLKEAGTNPKHSVIVEPKRKRTTIFGAVPELTEEEHRRRSDAADALWRELVRRAGRE